MTISAMSYKTTHNKMIQIYSLESYGNSVSPDPLKVANLLFSS